MVPEEKSELEKIIEALHYGDPLERVEAAEDIRYDYCSLDPDDPDAKLTVGALIEALSDEEPMVRCEVCQALGQLGETAIAAIPELIRVFTDDQESDVRESAVAGLSGIADFGFSPHTDQAVPLLIRALDDENEEVQRHAASTLGTLAVTEPYQLEVSLSPYTDQAVPLLIRALHHESKWARGGAAITLGRLVLADPYRLKEVVTALEKVAESSDEADSVRAVAYQAIERLSGEDT
jgi:HEAT repeat protein